MVQRIGNISGSKSQQVESDPEKERMRKELRDSFREEKIQRKVQKHLDEIIGERPLFESISDLLDGAGNPPTNAPIESITKQQRSLAYQLKWLEAWSLVFDKKLRSLDRERYWRERLAREHSDQERRREIREKKRFGRLDEQNGGVENTLLKSMEEAIETSYRAAKLREYLVADDLDAPVLGIRRIQSGLRRVFCAYVDLGQTSQMSADQEYTLVSEQLTWVGAMAAEIHTKLTLVIEISEAALGLSSDSR